MPHHELICKKLTLVCGLPRSGTTWIGKSIGSHPHTNYIFEPFSKRYHPSVQYSNDLFALLGNYIHSPEATPNYTWHFNEEIWPELELWESKTREHINELTNYYFHSRIQNHLVIKSPKTSKLLWLIKVLDPDHIIWIDRHLAAVVNSYIKLKQGLSGWSEAEFRCARQTICRSNPGLEQLFGIPQNRVERATFVLNLSKKLFLEGVERRNLSLQKFMRIQYEEFCLNYEESLSPVFNFMGLPYDEKIFQYITLKVQSNKAKVKHLDINKDSKSKVYQWVHEIAPKDLRSFSRMNRVLELNLPIPGNGFPAQSPKEKFYNSLKVIPRLVRRVHEQIESFRAKNNLTLSHLRSILKT